MEYETLPESGLIVRDNLSVIGWEGDTFIEVFLTPEKAAELGARLSHFARKATEHSGHQTDEH